MSSSRLEPQDAHFEARCRSSFARQRFMSTLGATLASVEPGKVVIDLPFRDDLTQQHGYMHAGVVTAAIDTACGYAALSLMPAGVAVLSVEFKINLMKPAAGERFRATGRVVRAGNTLTICSGEMRAFRGEDSDVVAVMQATIMAVRGRAGVSD